MTMTTLRDQFVHDLEDIYYAENELYGALEELANQTDDEEITEAFREHREETREQVDRLEQVFEMIGAEPEREECEGIDGLISEHKGFVGMDPDQRLLDLHNLVAGQKTEHYEIAAYSNLTLIAERLGESDAEYLLGEILEEEQATLEKLTDLAESFEYDALIESSAAD
jgi:ferritin-like metal-binding protein YciE